MPHEKQYSDEEWEAVRKECREKYPDLKVVRQTLQSDDDLDVMLIRQLLALPMSERTNFLRVPTPDGRGSYL